MSNNFIRKYRLTITSAKGIKVVIENLHIEFKISLSASSKLNELDLQIYNLSKDTLAAFSEVDAGIQLEVGYGDNPLATVFKGNKTFSKTKRDMTDVITDVLAAEGVLSVREGRSQTTLPPNTTVRSVIEKIITESMPEIKVKNLTGDTLSRTYDRGYSATGKAKANLDAICKANDLRWHIVQGGTINVFPINKDIGRKSIVLTPELIKNTPENTSKEVKDLKDDLAVPKKVGLNVTVQMNPLFVAGGLVTLQGTFSSDGTYVIEKVTHNGSFEGDVWDTVLECTVY